MKIKELIKRLKEYDGNMEVFISDELDRSPFPNIKLGYTETYPSMRKTNILLL